MKVLVVGGGSMGRRRLRDLHYLCNGQVMLFEVDPTRCAEVAERFGVKGFIRFDEALAQKPDAIVISTPPALHEQYVRAAVENRIPVFAELPFVLDKNAMAEIAERAKRDGVLLGISGTIRFYPPFSLIHRLLRDGRVGRPFYLEYSLGNHIADWHPHEDYRRFYAADMKLGGAGMDMILHEMAPIQWWLGDIATVAARLSKVSDLEINGPDTHDVLLTFASGCKGFFHHDILERSTIGRHVRIVGEGGTIEWHQNLPAVRLYTHADQKTAQLPFDQAPDWRESVEASKEVRGILNSSSADPYTYEANYLREMRHFLDAVAGNRAYTTATVEQELKNVRVFHALVDSSESFKEVSVQR